MWLYRFSTKQNCYIFTVFYLCVSLYLLIRFCLQNDVISNIDTINYAVCILILFLFQSLYYWKMLQPSTGSSYVIKEKLYEHAALHILSALSLLHSGDVSCKKECNTQIISLLTWPFLLWHFCKIYCMCIFPWQCFIIDEMPQIRRRSTWRAPGYVSVSSLGNQPVDRTSSVFASYALWTLPSSRKHIRVHDGIKFIGLEVYIVEVYM
jgi:hypothetical protein